MQVSKGNGVVSFDGFAELVEADADLHQLHQELLEKLHHSSVDHINVLLQAKEFTCVWSDYQSHWISSAIKRWDNHKEVYERNID